MTDTVVIFLPHFTASAEKIAQFLNADMKEYSRDIFAQVFVNYRRIVAVMAVGIVVRAISTLVRNKWVDPAIVIVSPNMVFAIPILGGHHGANNLAKELMGMGLTPVITTATEAIGKESVEAISDRLSCEILNRDSTRATNASMLDSKVPLYTIPGPGIVIAGPAVSIFLRRGEYTVGIGCRKGTSRDEIIFALESAFRHAQIQPDTVMAYATTERKRSEAGLLKAVAQLSGNLVFLDDQTINMQSASTQSKAENLGLKGVAEPCALALSKLKELVMTKKTYGRVTVAIAR